MPVPQGDRETNAYVRARAGLYGKEGDIDALWKTVVAADYLLERMEKLLPFVQAIAEADDDGIVILSEPDGNAVVYRADLTQIIRQAREQLT